MIVDAGPFGPDGAGHSHADVLSIVVRHGEEEIFIDPGTFTYVGEAHWRDWFRSTPAHNTVSVDGQSQGETARPFRWASKPEVRLIEHAFAPQEDHVYAECRYRDVVHRRRVTRFGDTLIAVSDSVKSKGSIAQHWHTALPVTRLSETCLRIGDNARITFPAGTVVLLNQCWHSTAFGEKQLATEVVAQTTAAVIEITGKPAPSTLMLENDEWRYRTGDDPPRLFSAS